MLEGGRKLEAAWWGGGRGARGGGGGTRERGVWSRQGRSSHPTLSPVQWHDAVVMVAGRQQHRGVLSLATLFTVGGRWGDSGGRTFHLSTNTSGYHKYLRLPQIPPASGYHWSCRSRMSMFVTPPLVTHTCGARTLCRGE